MENQSIFESDFMSNTKMTEATPISQICLAIHYYRSYLVNRIFMIYQVCGTRPLVKQFNPFINVFTKYCTKSAVVNFLTKKFSSV